MSEWTVQAGPVPVGQVTVVHASDAPPIVVYNATAHDGLVATAQLRGPAIEVHIRDIRPNELVEVKAVMQDLLEERGLTKVYVVNRGTGSTDPRIHLTLAGAKKSVEIAEGHAVNWHSHPDERTRWWAPDGDPDKSIFIVETELEP